MDYTSFSELLLTGMKIRSFTIRGEVIDADFGNGYGASVLVGHAGGLHRWTISAKILPGYTSLGTINSKAWFDYYYEFFIARTTGATRQFYIDWDGRWWHVRFAENEMSYEKFKGDLYAGPGIELVQTRVVGFSSYNSDGSMVGPSR